MTHDIQVKVMLSAEEYVAFKAVCEEEGQSMSGRSRSLIKHDIRVYAAKDIAASTSKSTDDMGHD